MKLVTCQSADVYDNIVRDGRHFCDISKSSFYTDNSYRRPYNWIARRLADKISRPEGATNPIWAYSCADLPEYYDEFGQGEEDKELFCLELEVPDEEVVAIDAGKWADIVGCGYVCPNDIDDEFDRIDAYYKKASRKVREANWDGVFDVSDCKNGTEILFWCIKAEYVKNVTRYACHLGS